MSQCLAVSPSLNVSLSQCLRKSQVSGLWSPPTTLTPARWARHRRSGNRRADMRHETRDLPGGRETLRQVEIAVRPMARPQGRQSLNVSRLTRSQCLAVSMSPQVSGLWSLVSPSPSRRAALPVCAGAIVPLPGPGGQSSRFMPSLSAHLPPPSSPHRWSAAMQGCRALSCPLWPKAYPGMAWCARG